MADAFCNQIIGVVRFSYPASNGFRLMGDDHARRMADLYHPVRLKQRLRLFEHLTLPSLLAQTEADYSLAVLIGTDLPAWAQGRLAEILAPLANARIIPLPPLLDQMEAAGQLRRTVLGRSATHVTEFRLDDDDAIDCAHIARLKARAAILVPMHGLDRPLVIGCNRGLVLTLQDGGNFLTDVTEKLPIGIGLAMTMPRHAKTGIFRRNHRLLPQFFSTFTDAEVPAFIRTVHATNDSQPHASGQSQPLTADAAQQILAAHFPFDLADLMAL